MEMTAAIGQCGKNGYHINPEYGIVEILDKNNKKITEHGKQGEIVTTSLHNYAMPFIRYKTGDLATVSSKKCACGRTGMPLVEKIIGRIEDFIITPDGNHVGRLDAAFKYSKGIKLSQIIQKTKESITVKIVKDTSYTKESEDRLLKELRARLGKLLKIDIDYVSNIPLTKSGKLKFVESKVGNLI